MPRTRPPYPEEFRREAVALIRSGQRTLAEASKSLGVSQQTLRTWLKREDVDAGRAEGVSSEEREELRRLRREVLLSDTLGGDGGGRQRHVGW
jgi:transposase